MIYFGDVKNNDKNSTYRPKTELDLLLDNEKFGYTDFIIDNIITLSKLGIPGATELEESLNKMKNTYYRMKSNLNNIEKFRKELESSYWFQFELYGYASIYNTMTKSDITSDLEGLQLLFKLYKQDYNKFIHNFDLLMGKKKELADELVKLSKLKFKSMPVIIDYNSVVSSDKLNSLLT